ncbi:MAG: GGDEF domain-containing protein, partial [Roseibium sp.]|uniref:GGDEF domain-containing protein n=1 Tax=Roseibium sp. TaxID=1936156 RepID=UPI002617F68E
MGDAVLRLFGSVCRDAETSQMVVGRLGGDEFGIYLNRTDSEVAETFTNQLTRRFSASCHETTNGRLKASVSAGISLAKPAHSIERALEVADQGVYRAKRNNHARVVVLRLNKSGRVSAVENQGYGKLRTAPL